MEPVHCIWVILRAPRGLENRVFTLESRYVEVAEGDPEDRREESSSGLANITCVYVGHPDKTEDVLSKLMGTLFYMGTMDERKRRLAENFNIQLDDKTKEELEKMSMATMYAD